MLNCQPLGSLSASTDSGNGSSSGIGGRRGRRDRAAHLGGRDDGRLGRQRLVQLLAQSERLLVFGATRVRVVRVLTRAGHRADLTTERDLKSEELKELHTNFLKT